MMSRGGFLGRAAAGAAMGVIAGVESSAQEGGASTAPPEDAAAWVNGMPAGDHLRGGYARFTLDGTRALRWGERNELAVQVTSAFDEHMLPRSRLSDWAHDGGICRPVALPITPRGFVERVAIAAEPDGRRGTPSSRSSHTAGTSGRSA